MTIVKKIEEASKLLNGTVKNTPLQQNKHLSEKYKAKIYLKREDLQEVRSFKIRGAYNKIISLSDSEKKKGVVCASAGNHAQGVAYCCSKLRIKGVIFMPTGAPQQKIDRVQKFGGKYVEIKLKGETFDEANIIALQYAKKHYSTLVHAFDDLDIISGQGTVGKEILDQLKMNPDIVLVPVGGGGLISGVSAYIKEKSPQSAIIGVEANGGASLYTSLLENKVTTLPNVDTFVDGTAVKTIGKKTFKLCKQYVNRVIRTPEGLVAKTMVDLYQNDGIVTEPAGALSIAALEELKDMIEGKNIVCIISGGNNDILRYAEILEKSLIYQGRKHYFIIEFAQKPGRLKNFLDNILGPSDDIVRFEYIKKTNTGSGPALVGIEQKKKKHYEKLLERMEKSGIKFQVLNPEDAFYKYIV